MTVATLLHPELSHVEGLSPKALCPEQVAVALKHTHHVIITDLLHQTTGHVSVALACKLHWSQLQLLHISIATSSIGMIPISFYSMYSYDQYKLQSRIMC